MSSPPTTGPALRNDGDNAVPPLEPYDLYSTDPVLGPAMAAEGASSPEDRATLEAFGRRVGTAEVFGWGHDANRFSPELATHGPQGERIDEVTYHPTYHRLLELSVGAGLHCLRYEREPGDGGYVTRNALMYLVTQVDMGHCCPISMTGAALPALRHQPELAEAWEPRLVSRDYDPRSVTPAEKGGCLVGMGMTERQGGSDVRANTSTAVARNGGGPGTPYRLQGHKWFTSAPMCDAFLMLAQAPGGLSCFLVPRILDDGSRNGLHYQRLKDKLGNRSNASAELEYDDATGWLVGEEGRGVRTIIDMVNGTRIDCAVWAVALMRQAVTRAGWHAAHRAAFGARLLDKPLMANVLADLELEVEAATLMMARMSGAYDRASLDAHEADVARIGITVGKYWLTKRSSPVVREALECIGGNGYVEESILPRLYREVPLNAIWEGAGNVIALDLLRAVTRSPQTLDALLDEIHGADDPTVRAEAAALRRDLVDPADPEAEARHLVERLARCWAAALLVERGDPAVAETYVRSRLGGHHGWEFGTLEPGAHLAAIAERTVPQVS